VPGEVAGGGYRGAHHADDAEQDKERLAGPRRGHDAPVQGREEAAEAQEVAGTDDGGHRVRLSITARRVRIDPAKKRRSYIRRLERVMRECDSIISDPQGYEEIQVQAMAILIRAISLLRAGDRRAGGGP